MICASLLFFNSGKLKSADRKLNDMVNIVLHQSVKNFALPKTTEAKVKTTRPLTEKTADGVSEKTQANTAQPVMNSTEGGQIGRLAKTSEEIYIAELKYDLEKRKKYPVMAKKMGHTGRVTIKFEINRRGEIIHSEILAPAAHASLNESVQNLLIETKTFKPFPDEIQRTTWKFVLPVEFKL